MKLPWLCCTCSNDFDEGYDYRFMLRHFVFLTSRRRALSLMIMPSPCHDATSPHCSHALTKSQDTTVIGLTLTV